MDFYWLIVGILAVWRVTHLLQAEDGPWDFVVRLRRAAGQGFWGKLLDCFYCLSIWVALPAALLLGRGAVQVVFLWLALSGGAILLERLVHREPALSDATYYEGEESDDGMLREPEKASSDQPAKSSTV